MSLNNRILIRDTYEARGGVIDCEVVTVPAAAARSEATTDTIILDAVKPQEDLMKQSIAETEVEEIMNSKSCGRHTGVLLSYASSRSRNGRRVMPINELVVLFIVCTLLFANMDASKHQSSFYLSAMIFVQFIGCAVRPFPFTQRTCASLRHQLNGRSYILVSPVFRVSRNSETRKPGNMYSTSAVQIVDSEVSVGFVPQLRSEASSEVGFQKISETFKFPGFSWFLVRCLS